MSSIQLTDRMAAVEMELMATFVVLYVAIHRAKLPRSAADSYQQVWSQPD